MQARELAKALTMTPNEARKHGLDLNQDGVRRSAFDLLSYPDIGLAGLAARSGRNLARSIGRRPNGWKPRRDMPSISTGSRPMPRRSGGKKAR